MTTAILRYTAAANTDRGRKRTSNEDAFGYSVEHGVYVVCDGMGGAAAGEIASSLAIDEVLRIVTERREAESGTIPEIVAEAVEIANEAIHSRSQRNARLNGMGTTFVGILVEENRLWVAHIGDSRCYRLHDKALHQITEDHSLIEEQIRMGRMSRAEGARSPLRNVITRALGTQSHVTPDLVEIEAVAGDLYLLCSDGLIREVPDDKIESLMNSSESLDEICARLIQAANKAGGHDNITCLVVRVD